MKKKLPIGISDYKKLRTNDYYYVDKTHLIQEILEYLPEVLLLPRPRRFGKTLNLSMLRYFFEQSARRHARIIQWYQDRQHPECMKEQGQYPVIFISLQGCERTNMGKHLCYSF